MLSQHFIMSLWCSELLVRQTLFAPRQVLICSCSLLVCLVAPKRRDRGGESWLYTVTSSGKSMFEAATWQFAASC